jgi:hypothetical protein
VALTCADPSSGEDARAQLARELRRTGDRLASLSLARLSGPTSGHESLAVRVRETAQRLADAAAGIEARDRPRPPAPRPLPTLREHALADQLAVTGTDVWLASVGLAHDVPVWDHAVRRPLGEVLTDTCEAVAALRRALP